MVARKRELVTEVGAESSGLGRVLARQLGGHVRWGELPE